MGTIISSACNSSMLSSVTQALCEFVLNGISGKTFDKIRWRLSVKAMGDKDTTYNIKLENITKTITILEETNIKLKEDKIEINGKIIILSPWLRYSNGGTISQDWVGDTLKASIIKQSGSTPEKLQIYTNTQTHYTD